jgi:hypothetical protein
MQRVRVVVWVLTLGAACASCHNNIVAVPAPSTSVVVVGALQAPNGLQGFVINSGSPGSPNNPVTCAALVCYQTIQLMNNGANCAGNINGQTNVFIAPASSANLLRSSPSGFLIPGNPSLVPGQVVTVNVTIPEQPSVNYVVTETLNWSAAVCPQ